MEEKSKLNSKSEEISKLKKQLDDKNKLIEDYSLEIASLSNQFNTLKTKVDEDDSKNL